jgi:hypothetical protein
MQRTVWTGVRKLLDRVQRRVAMLEDPHEAVIELQPQGAVRGVVLLSYVIDPFLLHSGANISNAHTHHWESWRIAQSFLERGFAVDVISYRNGWFVPHKPYVLLFGARTNFHRLSLAVPAECRKVVHLDTAHWLFNNTAACSTCSKGDKRRCTTRRW